MKKHSLAEFLKSKSFYALLCVGVLAIVAITMVGLNQASDKEQGNNLVDLNEPSVSDVADNESLINTETDLDNTTSGAAANNEEGTSQTEVAQTTPNGQVNYDEPVTDGSLLEFDVEVDPESVAANPADNQEGATADSATTQTADGSTTGETAPETVDESHEVMSPETLYFDVEDGLLWPVTGNVLMNYSVDRVIYHETLEQFRCNPAVIIDAEIGSQVLSAATGVITSITEENETGTTVTTSIGNGYSLVYGQLEDVKFKVGDMVNEGEILGTIAKPTMYYTVEGNNLYFQVLENEETVNPMSLLR